MGSKYEALFPVRSRMIPRHLNTVRARFTAGAFLLACCAVPVPAQGAEPAQPGALDQHVVAGDRLFQRGDFESALREWDQALRTPGAETQPLARADVLVREAEAYRALGHVERAIIAFTEAASLAAPDDARTARVLAGLGGALQAAGVPQEARERLEASIALAEKAAPKASRPSR